MIKLVYCIRRRADVSPERFHHYWLHEHGPKVRSVATAIGARRYVQSHTGFAELNAMLAASRGLAPAYDGITEIWWDSEPALRAALESEEGRTASHMLLTDEATFIDFAQSRIFMTTEHEIFDIST